jgi:hypothetical protein
VEPQLLTFRGAATPDESALWDMWRPWETPGYKPGWPNCVGIGHCPVVARRVRCGCRGLELVRDPGAMEEVHDSQPDREAVAAPLHRYTSPDEDSARWWNFPFRPGDIVN